VTEEPPPPRTGLPRTGLPRTGLPRTGLPATTPAPAPAEPAARPARQGLGGAPATPGAPEPALADPVDSNATVRAQGPRGIRRWILLSVALVVAAGAVIIASRWLVTLDPVRDFMTTYPGETGLPDGAPTGIPAWLGWQHFFNAFFLVLMIKTGWQVRTQRRPPASWTRSNTGPLATRNPPRKISLTLWLHLSLDALWFVNGVLFVVLLFVSGHWVRVVPTDWAVVPNAISAALQYASLDWPQENGWVNYNSLQLLAYFATIFVAAPLAAVTGIRMSGAWSKDWVRLSRVYPVEVARAIHFPVMLYFVLFVIAHVTLVLATGALRNLNHIYTARDTSDWVGFGIFAASLVLMAGAWVLARPAVVAPIASLMGKVSR
jgi:thiosulfate reductase cytochrome b subunit